MMELLGYAANVSTANVGTTAASTISRVIARINRITGVVDVTTSLGTGMSGSYVNGVISNDGNNLWAGGFNGIFYQTYGSTSTPAAGFSSQMYITSLRIFENQLYTGTSTGTYKIGNGLQTTPGQNATALPGNS